jgi:Zn-dependent M32 family carboxypeptidase
VRHTRTRAPNTNIVKPLNADVHWSVGALGYFPSYTLGSMMAAQLYEQALLDLPGLEADISQGKFTRLREVRGPNPPALTK